MRKTGGKVKKRTAKNVGKAVERAGKKLKSCSKIRKIANLILS